MKRAVMVCMKSAMAVTMALFWLMQGNASAQDLISAKRIYVDHGDYANSDNPACHWQAQDQVLNLAVGLMEGKLPSVPAAVGVVLELTVPQLQHMAAQTAGGFLSNIVAPDRYSSCGTVFIKLPPGTTDVSPSSSLSGPKQG
jgi:hypothetical protein